MHILEKQMPEFQWPGGGFGGMRRVAGGDAGGKAPMCSSDVGEKIKNQSM